jgi:glycosyltransferase involved in cell wall biosynthesis
MNHFEININGSIIVEDKNYAQNLNNLILQYNLENNIKINPNVSFQELQEQVKESKFWIHPTPEEPFGISIVEALSAGLIPIVPDNGGATEFVPPQYQYRTIEDASNMIYKILKNISNKYDGKIEIEKQKFNENVTRVIESILENNTFSDSLSSRSFVVLNHPVIIE